MKKYLALLLLAISFQGFAQSNLITGINISLPANPDANIAEWSKSMPPLMISAQTRMEQGKVSPMVQESSILVSIKGNGVVCGHYSIDNAPASNFNSPAKVWSGETALNLLGEACVLKPGIYEFCVKFYGNGAAGQVLIGEACKSFTIKETERKSYQPPQALAPVNGLSYTTGDFAQPQLFRWTPVIPKPQEPVTYRLKVWQMMQGQTSTQAMQVNQPIITKDVENMTQIVINNILDDPCKPPYLCDFVWNVQALNREGNPIGDNKGMSSPFQFAVNKAAPNVNKSQPVVEEEVVVPTGSLAANDTIYAGYNGEFAIITTQVSGTNKFSGKGTAFINWLKARVSVKFDSITVDANKKLLTGKISAEIDDTAPVYPQDWALEIAANNPWLNNMVTSHVTWVESKINQTIPYNNLTEVTTPVKLPLGLNFPNGDQLAITEMVFRNNKSEFNMVTSKTTPQDWGNPVQLVGFIAKNIEFHPSNIKMPPNRIELVEDVTIIANPKINFTFKKPTNSNTGCFVEWGENGFSQFGIEIHSEFTRDWLLPSPDDGISKTKAKLFALGTAWNDLVLTGTLEKSEIVSAQGMTVLADSLSYDMSDVLNPPSITFPQNYDGETSNLFRGFYMKELVVEMPATWQTHSGGKPQISVQNMIIDNTGITLFAEATNVVQFPNANVADLVASIDTVHVEIESSSLVEASVKGRIGLPVSKADSIQNPLKYIALFNNAQLPSQTSYFQLTIEPTGPIYANLLKGVMTLAQTSNIVAYVDKNKKTFNTMLNGNFVWNNVKLGPVKNVNMNLGFQGIAMNYDSSLASNKFTFNAGAWSFASPQKFLANFPVTIDNIGFKQLTTTGNQLLHGKLNFDVIFNLSTDVGGQSKLAVELAIEDNQNASGLGKFKPKYIGTSISDISVYANLPAVSIDGTIQFRNDDPVFGNGFKGTLQATFKAPKVSISALAEFGNTSYLHTSTYRYWRVEAAAIFQPGLPFLPGVAFYGFGGGASNNMLATINNSTKKYDFTPKKGSLGFKVLAVIGTTPKVETFNADVGLNGQFSAGQGMYNIGFTGDFYIGAPLLPLIDRNKAQIKGSVIADYNFPDKHFYMYAAVTVNAPPITTPSPAELTLDTNGKTNKWFFKFGEPTDTNVVTIFGVNLYEYLMFGNDIKAPVNGFTEGFRNSYYSVVNQYPGIPSFPGVDGNSATGRGFALGVGIKIDKNFNEHIVNGYYLNLILAAGAEVNLSMMEYLGQNCANPSQRIGLNGWRARGNIGFYVDAAAKVVKGNDTWNLANLKAGGWLDAKFPRPTYVAGAVQGNIQIGHSTARAHTFAPGQCTDKYCTHKWPNGNLKHTLINGVTGLLCSNITNTCSHIINNYLVNQSFNKTFDWGDNCGSGDTTQPASTGPAIAQQDAAADQEQLLIKYVHPGTTYNFPITMPIAVKYGLPLNEEFDISEQQSSGSIINRTFKLVTTVTLQEKNETTGVYATINKKFSKNNLGEYLYVKLGAIQAQSIVAPVTNSKNNPLTPQSAVQQIASMPVSNVPNNISNVSLSKNVALQTFYPAPEVGEYDNLPPEPAAVVNSLEVNKWYKIIVTANLKEFKNNVWVNALKSNGSPVTQTVIKTFRTGPMQLVSTNKVINNNIKSN
ncbi:hypothetical protein [Lutibacter sp.]|uniref:hypothetical protein n=1 Tax=Lutibacter sp. TaxID=1925666 RepID=UPI002733D3C4|nr:hypothetical protein [Lutibacter sp.]MDP3312042.1 hypothetical protein [Lutibacter sp.]